MSWSTCYTGSNNIHYNDPPLMMDGRTYASWQPEAVVNKKIQVTENINILFASNYYLLTT